MKYIRNSLAICGLVLGISSLVPNTALSAPRFIIDFSTDRVGQDYRKFGINSMESCLRACASEGQCQAFTYVPPYEQPGQANPEGICWLKDGVPKATRVSGGMISGVKQ